MKFYRYYNEIGTLNEIEDYIKLVEDNFYDCNPVEFSTSDNTDVFSVLVLNENNKSLIQVFTNEELEITDPNKLTDIVNKKFWTIQNKEYAIIYNNSLNTTALLALLRRVSLCDYKQIFVKVLDDTYGIYRTMEF